MREIKIAPERENRMERDLLVKLSKFVDQEERFEDAGLGALIVNVDAVGKNDLRPRMDVEYLGIKAIVASTSDVVAKSGRPVRYTLYVSHPDKDVVYRMAEAAYKTVKRFSGSIISGDVDSEPMRVVSTCIGYSYRFTRRSGARPGEKVYLLGPIGHGGALSYALKRNLEPPKEALELMKYEYFDPERSRVTLKASSAMDVSDGLAVTLWDIAELSSVRIEVDYERLRKIVPTGISKRADEHGIDPADLALYGGDEYVIVYTSEDNLGGEEIGEVLEGEGVNAKRIGREHR